MNVNRKWLMRTQHDTQILSFVWIANQVTCTLTDIHGLENRHPNRTTEHFLAFMYISILVISSTHINHLLQLTCARGYEYHVIRNSAYYMFYSNFDPKTYRYRFWDIRVVLETRVRGHSSSIGIDTDRSAAYDFLLTFHSNQWPPFPR